MLEKGRGGGKPPRNSPPIHFFPITMSLPSSFQSLGKGKKTRRNYGSQVIALSLTQRYKLWPLQRHHRPMNTWLRVTLPPHSPKGETRTTNGKIIGEKYNEVEQKVEFYMVFKSNDRNPLKDLIYFGVSGCTDRVATHSCFFRLIIS